MPRPLQAVLILLHVLFVATLVGAIRALSTASSVDAVDGYLLGLLLYASLPGVAAFVLSLYVRHGGVRVWYGLLAVQAWIVLGALAELSGGSGGEGVARLVIPAAVIVLLCRPESRRWFRSELEQRAEQRLFSFARMMKLRRDGGQTALEYLGLVLVVVALVGGLMATGTGRQLTAEIRSAICELTGSSCPAPGHDLVAGGGSADGSGSDSSGGSGSAGAGGSGGGDASGVGDGGGESSLTGGTGSTGTSGDTGGTATTGSTAGSGGSAGTGGTTGSTAGSNAGSTAGSNGSAGAPGDATRPQGNASSPSTQGGDSFPPGDVIVPVDAGRPAGPNGGGFLGGFLGDGLGGDVQGVVDAVLRPGDSGRRIVDQWGRDTRGAGEKWARGDYIGAAWDWNKAVGGAGAGLAIPGSGARVDAEVREAERAHLSERIPQNAAPAEHKAWWDGLSPEERERYIELVPERIGNLDGIPVLARDAANRRNLPALIDKLEGVDTDKARDQLAGLREIERQLNENGKPPMYLIGIGDEGNGRAIVSFGNPDASQHVSAYVPGLNTSLDEEFAKNDLGRARDTAIGAQGYDESTASIVWLGYDAPQLPDKDGVAGYFAVMGTGRAEKGGEAYRGFMDGISVTNQNKDPHLTAIGHSYGSRTVGAAAAKPGGIPGVDDIILVGSPGVGVDHAVDLGVGSEHVFVGAAANDPVTKLPSKTQVVVGGIGLALGGPGGAYIAGDLADPGDDDLWFGKDPASKAFGARRFPVADGPPLISGSGISLDSHSNYFSPERDAVSADSIALIVSGNADRLKMEEPK
ncbi:alpha/beta hydrolase [Streptomyces sp. ATCC51928]|uniref:Alpha/beta hydrolase n=1 Tax=Streptomyces caviscabies TaxID=90079 RepID=A0ABW2MP37_9ACTN|nr:MULTISPECIES: alpha/beta hydrolase [unclassified Streptomyces]MDX3506299.1 alpha/beta hydrolase [Streptomyces sp. ATCC51928]MDX5526235.1 alpha/beta hydrolase [Streptomyces sp. DE06-01C]